MTLPAIPLAAPLTLPTPVTLLSGFLGSGKTSVLNHLLACMADQRLAVLVNDFGELSVDAQLIGSESSDTIALANGCICCSIKGDLVGALERVLSQSPTPERIFVEQSGLSDPGSVVRTITMLEQSLPLMLDGVIAVVDAERFPEPDDPDHLLMREQLALSDIVLLNKTDLVTDARIEELAARIREYKPSARLLPAIGGQVPAILLCGRSVKPRPSAASDTVSPGGATQAGSTALPGALEPHAFQSYSYESSVPLSLGALRQTMVDLPDFVVRAKGVIYLKERPSRRAILQVVGRRARLHAGQLWQNETPATKLVFIGPGARFDKHELERIVRTCEASRGRWFARYGWLQRMGQRFN